MAKYRKKPIVVEAERWLPKQDEWPGRDIPDKLGVIWEFDCTGQVCNGFVTTIHGQEAKVAKGDWVITEPDGEHFYPCKPDIFEETYEKIE